MLNLSNDAILGYLLLIIIFGFGILIFFLLKLSRNLMTKDLQTTSTTVWKTISEQAGHLNLKEHNLIFGIFQDVTSFKTSLIVKDSANQVIGTIVTPTISTVRILTIGNDNFSIKYPLTWKSSALLYSPDGKVLAKYRRTGSFGKHEFEIVGLGILQSTKPTFSFKSTFYYQLGGKTVGFNQALSSLRAIGKVSVFSLDLPLAIRIFILAI